MAKKWRDSIEKQKKKNRFEAAWQTDRVNDKKIVDSSPRLGAESIRGRLIGTSWRPRLKILASRLKFLGVLTPRRPLLRTLREGIQYYRRWLHRAIAPMAKKLWEQWPRVATTGILLCQFFETVKWVNVGVWFSPLQSSLISWPTFCIQCTKGALISAWKCTKSVWRLGSAWTHWEYLQRLPRPLSWI